MNDDRIAARTASEFMAGVREEIATISAADAHRLPEGQFRASFREIVLDFICDYGRPWAEANLRLLSERLRGRDLDALTTAEMREIVLVNQYWFDPRGGHPVAPDPYEEMRA